MKVLFISSGNAKEGISPTIKNQGESLVKAGIDLEFFTIKGKGLGSYLKHIFEIQKHIKYNAYDLYHAHYALSAFAATLAGCKPLVVSLMGSDIKSGITVKYIIRLFNSLRWRTLIVKSSLMREEAGIASALVIPNGVDLNKVKPVSAMPDNSSPKSVLFAAEPGKYVKNYQLAEKAVGLIGEFQINLNVVHYVSHQKIIEEINKAHVLLLTSKWEGSPNIIKEAMACNCPVVSTDVGDVKWLFGDEPGHFIAEHNPSDVADNIKKAIEFSENNGRTSGRQRIIALGLDSDTVANRIIAVYKKVIEGRK